MEKGEHDEGEKERLDLEYDIEEEVNKVLKGVRVCRKEVFECERGKSSCKNMGTAFI